MNTPKTTAIEKRWGSEYFSIPFTVAIQLASKLETENNELREIIRLAKVEWAKDGISDGQAAAAMFEILCRAK